MKTLAISSFSLHAKLGPWHFEYRDEDGSIQVHTVPMPTDHTLEEFAQQVSSRFGVGAVELCQIQFNDSSPERLDRLKHALDAAHVSVLTVPIDIGDLSGTTPEQRADDITRITGWLDVAKTLGATFARVNTGTPHTHGASDDLTGLIEALRQLAAAAQERGLHLLIENHGGASSDPDYLLALRDAVGAENLGILLDLGNFEPVNVVSMARMSRQEMDEFDIDTEPVYARIARLAPHATLVHAKSYDVRSDGTPLLDLDRALRIVAEAGYNGSITVEWEGLLGDPWEHAARTIDAVVRVFPELAPQRTTV